MDYTADRLSVKNAKFAAGYDAVCLFVNDTADAETLWILSMAGVRPDESARNDLKSTNSDYPLLFNR